MNDIKTFKLFIATNKKIRIQYNKCSVIKRNSRGRNDERNSNDQH